MNMNAGSVEFITGVMNSCKSYDLIERIEEAVGRDMKFLILKPSVDTRDGAFVKSRMTEKTFPAVMVDETDLESVARLIDEVKKYEVIFIDEVQFMSAYLIEKLILSTFMDGVAIVASGLTKDFKGVTFPASEFMQIYNTAPVTFRKSHCYFCGKPKGERKATIDVRMDAKDNIVTEGESVSVEGTDTSYHYATVCTKCFKKKGGK